MAAYLTPHFSLEELTHSQTASRLGFANSPKKNSQEYKNLLHLAQTMEKVRVVLNDKPLLISSGFRSSHVNSAMGGSKNSAHVNGLAADFTCPAFGSPLEVCRELKPHMQALAIDQLIYEYETWVHLGLRDNDPPRCMALTIDRKGTRNGFA